MCVKKKPRETAAFCFVAPSSADLDCDRNRARSKRVVASIPMIGPDPVPVSDPDPADAATRADWSGQPARRAESG